MTTGINNVQTTVLALLTKQMKIETLL